MKYTYINFSSKQRSFYITKSSRGPDPTTQRAGFGPRAVCLTPLPYIMIVQPSSNRVKSLGDLLLLWLQLR